MQLDYQVGEKLLLDGELLEVIERSRNRWGGMAVRVARPSNGMAPVGRRWLTPRLSGSRSSVIDRHALHDMVHAFYGRVRADPTLGPVFEARLADRWEPHLAKMVSFWASVLLAEGSFAGDPMSRHRAIGEGRPEHFARWLVLFRATLAEVFAEPAANVVFARALGMARGLSTAMFGQPFDALVGAADASDGTESR